MQVQEHEQISGLAENLVEVGVDGLSHHLGLGPLEMDGQDGEQSAPVGRVADPDPDWIRIQLGRWIRIRIRNPDPGGQK